MRTIRATLFALLFVVMVALALTAARQPLYAQAEEPPPGETIPPPTIFLPVVSRIDAPTPEPTPVPDPTQIPLVYAAIPVEPPSSDRPAAQHGDLNLALRSYISTTGYLGLVTYGEDGEGPDPNAPQIDGMFAPPRLPAFRSLHQVYDWDWNCGADGCRGAPITAYPVTLIEMETMLNEAVSIPRRAPDIYQGSFNALVLYAEERRLTVTYTRRDTAAVGYLIHLEDFAVNPGLVALYEQLNAAGRGQLPALRNGEVIGVADRGSIKIATRDTGQFLDPRACKDWWSDYMAQCTVQLRR
jgi:hypothetical protein